MHTKTLQDQILHNQMLSDSVVSLPLYDGWSVDSRHVSTRIPAATKDRWAAPLFTSSLVVLIAKARCRLRSGSGSTDARPVFGDAPNLF